jgi:hypothetical protein
MKPCEEHMTGFRLSRKARTSLTACALMLSAALDARGQTNADPEEFSAFAVNMGRLATGATAQVIINISRWSPEAERESLLTTLREKGQQALLRALRDTRRVGSIRTPHSIGYDLHLAYQEPAKDGRRRIIIATDRPIGFIEAANRPPTIDYPFTVIELLLRPDGTGEGTISIASKLIPAGKTIVVENYDTAPVQLMNIESRKTKQ